MNKISTLAETTENYFDNTVLETTDTIDFFHKSFFTQFQIIDSRN